MTEGMNQLKMFSTLDFLNMNESITGGIIRGSLLGGFVRYNMDGSLKVNTDKSAKDSNQHAFNEVKMTFKRLNDFNILTAAVEKIFPKDDLGPGAAELGIPFFIDRQLTTSWGTDSMYYIRDPFKESETAHNRKDIFLEGIRLIETVSQEKYSDSFSNLDNSQQISILQMFENDDVNMKHIDSSMFFELLRSTTIEAVYADPFYAGDQDSEEYPEAQMNYRNTMKENVSVDEEFTLIEPIRPNR